MFVRASTLILAVVASVIAAPGGTSVTSSQCDTGTLQCCNQVVPASSVSSLEGLLGISSIEGLAGLNCNPITAVGVGSGASCDQQPVCCTDVSENGLVNLGCSPVNLSL